MPEQPAEDEGMPSVSLDDPRHPEFRAPEAETADAAPTKGRRGKAAVKAADEESGASK